MRTQAGPAPGTRSPLRGWRGLLVAATLLSAATVVGMTCGGSTVPPGQNPITLGLCGYPRACYLVNADGPLAGQCDDRACSSQGHCRLVFHQDPNATTAGIGVTGTWTLAEDGGVAPSISDTPGVCSVYSASSGMVATCASPESVCIARGPACAATSYCVHRSGSASPAELCSSGLPITPQHRPTGGGLMTYCPLVDDVCCGPSGDGGMPDGGPDDAGPPDGGMTDAGAADAGSRDATPG